VEVTGKASHPGVYSFPHLPSLGEVWQRAGAPGTAPEPDKPIASGSRIEVTPEGGYRLAAMSGDQLLTLGLAIDLNRASAEDLAAVPGIGPALAQRIVEYRQAHGSFQKIEDLEEKVLGFGAKKVEKIKPFLIVAETNGTADECR
jgi:competence protein ComEA